MQKSISEELIVRKLAVINEQMMHTVLMANYTQLNIIGTKRKMLCVTRTKLLVKKEKLTKGIERCSVRTSTGLTHRGVILLSHKLIFFGKKIFLQRDLII